MSEYYEKRETHKYSIVFIKNNKMVQPDFQARNRKIKCVCIRECIFCVAQNKHNN